MGKQTIITLLDTTGKGIDSITFNELFAFNHNDVIIHDKRRYRVMRNYDFPMRAHIEEENISLRYEAQEEN